MAGTTPIYGLPYPTGTDRVADGDNAMQALAEKVETLLRAGTLTNATTDPQGYLAIPMTPAIVGNIRAVSLQDHSQPDLVGALIMKWVPGLTNNSALAVRVYNGNNGTIVGNFSNVSLSYFVLVQK